MGKANRCLKYPKFAVLVLMFAAAYVMLGGRSFAPFHDVLVSLGYAGSFIAGIFYSYGFTGAPAAAVFLIMAHEQNIILAAVLGGLGSLFTDMVLFKVIRHSFNDEIDMLAKEKLIVGAGRRLPKALRRHILTAVAFFIIASPLPDEIWVSMLACEKWISTRLFSVLSFALNTSGIFIVLWLGTML
ncbi:MAG: hypothetical protein V1813_04270 [Candidatus Aenigmatarchaeota archaeon]